MLHVEGMSVADRRTVLVIYYHGVHSNGAFGLMWDFTLENVHLSPYWSSQNFKKIEVQLRFLEAFEAALP